MIKKFKAKIQVKKGSYTLNQISFNNLHNQLLDIQYIINKYHIKNPRILIVGVGDDLLRTILISKFKYQVKTLDIDPNLNPDYLTSIDNINNVIHKRFDITICTHVLEHLPIKYFNKTIKHISQKTKYSIIYLPIAKFGIGFSFKLIPIFEKNINFLMTWFFKKHKFDGQHYWEIGTKKHPLSHVRKTITKHFEIIKEYNAKNWLYSYNFILKSTNHND